MLKNAKWHKAPFIELEEGYIGFPYSNNLSTIKKGDKYGQIDFDGNIQTKIEHDYPITGRDLIIFEDGFDRGLMKSDGTIIHPATASSIEFFEAEKLYGLDVENDAFLMREDGTLIQTELQLRDIDSKKFHEGLIRCEFWLDDEKTLTAHGFMDAKGKLLMEAKYRNIGDFSGGIAPVSDINWGNPCYIDKKGKVLFQAPENWNSISSFKGDLARVSIEEEGTAYINRDFEIVIKPQKYGSAGAMSNGLYTFSIENRKGAYNKKGELVISPDMNFSNISHFNESKVIVNQPKFKKKHKDPRKLWSWSNIIDQFGVFDFVAQEIVVPANYNSIYRLNETMIHVFDENRKQGYIAEDGTIMTDVVFDDLNTPYDNKAWVLLDGKWGVIEFDKKDN